MRLTIVSVLLLATNAFSMRLPLQMDGNDSSSSNPTSSIMDIPMLPTSTIDIPDTSVPSPTPPFDMEAMDSPSDSPIPTNANDSTPPADDDSASPESSSDFESTTSNDDAIHSPSPAPAPSPCDFAYAPTPNEVYPVEAPNVPGPIIVQEDGTLLCGAFQQVGGLGGVCQDYNVCADAVWGTCIPGWEPMRQNEYYFQCVAIPSC